ncbi:Mitochondrial import inner membrane translocase subunit Tim17/Tim22/Tim23 family protein [Striga hermonthica]|uniref:Mitochondrial import inner membrane translocase subunit Tim17/Tim22/Tim23 family protein n=1 Tax=Striga hermonthica TaxID=68872 RepID=A0A9N7MU25_STRHE|nr:Mitochondrial import inner membrane translocase subunit Tim17/Tim22/Tim23 family protein [Striga hermonthica]
MAADDPVNSASPSSSPAISTSSVTWKERIFIPTLLAGVAGAAFGLVSKHRNVHGLSQISATYASNFAIVTGCYCGAREFVRVSRTGKPDDLWNSVIGGFGSGAILGRLQGGQIVAVRYSVMFAAVGTAVDYATLKAKPALRKLVEEKESWFKLPEWSPIQVLDDEAVAAKRAREQQIFRNVHNLNKEES